MTDTDPAIICPQIWNWNAAQMSANCRAHKQMGISSRIQTDLTSFIQESFCRELVCFLMDFLGSQSPDENRNAVPHNLKDLSWRDLRDIYLQISISVVSCPSVESSNDRNCIHSCKISQRGVVNSTQHIDLSSPDVCFLLIVNSVFVKPVIKRHLKVDMVSEVSWPCRCDEELRLIRDQMIIVELFRCSLIVLSYQTKIESTACRKIFSTFSYFGSLPQFGQKQHFIQQIIINNRKGQKETHIITNYT